MGLLKKKRTFVRVLPDAGKWLVTTDAVGDIETFRLKYEALAVARCVAIATQPSELVEENRRGEIVDRSTFPRSSDPPGRG